MEKPRAVRGFLCLKKQVFSCANIPYIVTMTIRDINTATPEGKLLMAALAILTTTKEVKINGTIVNGTDTTPDQMLAHVNALSIEMYKD